MPKFEDFLEKAKDTKVPEEKLGNKPEGPVSKEGFTILEKGDRVRAVRELTIETPEGHFPKIVIPEGAKGRVVDDPDLPEGEREYSVKVDFTHPSLGGSYGVF